MTTHEIRIQSTGCPAAINLRFRKNVTATPEEIYELVTTAVRNSPSAFNSQTVRAVVLI